MKKLTDAYDHSESAFKKHFKELMITVAMLPAFQPKMIGKKQKASGHIQYAESLYFCCFLSFLYLSFVSIKNCLEIAC